MTADTGLAARGLAATAPARAPAKAETPAEAAPAFEDIIDALNPLHHIPGVSLVYEAATGDGISAASRLAGGFLFGGPLGLLGGAASLALQAATGDSLGGHLAGLAGGAGAAAPETASAPQGLPWMAGGPAKTALPVSTAVAREALSQGPTESSATVLPAAAGPTGGTDPRTLAALYEMQAGRATARS
ncbi:hypothetical protein [Arenibaculum pallidiluteum]|uniref:hypothetical protein n=1 Tax=Arenibaculum pallidiluteum TaxID=2812559 RepID=UPI001A95FB33|nr:hypothetical protein [Arenibaculum pallidiluteum]